jgi:methionine-rich copper-binding protein CopC
VDITAPTISSTTPADNATGVSRSSNVTIVFNEPIQFNKNDFSLTEIVSSTVVTEVPCAVTISTDKLTVTMNPTSDMSATADHNLHISGSVKDLSGNYIAAPVNRQFTTGS